MLSSFPPAGRSVERICFFFFPCHDADTAPILPPFFSVLPTNTRLRRPSAFFSGTAPRGDIPLFFSSPCAREKKSRYAFPGAILDRGKYDLFFFVALLVDELLLVFPPSLKRSPSPPLKRRTAREEALFLFSAPAMERKGWMEG